MGKANSGSFKKGYTPWNKGSKHWNWKGGITPRSMGSIEHKQWRTSVFERDDYTCQMCGDDTGGNLEAHHIFEFSKYKCLRFEVYNGQTLCRKCHQSLRNKEFWHRVNIVRSIFRGEYYGFRK